MAPRAEGSAWLGGCVQQGLSPPMPDQVGSASTKSIRPVSRLAAPALPANGHRAIASAGPLAEHQVLDAVEREVFLAEFRDMHQALDIHLVECDEDAEGHHRGDGSGKISPIRSRM